MLPDAVATPVLDALVNEFCASYHTYHSIAPVRRRRQARALDRFVREVGAPLDELEPDHLQGYLTRMLENGLQPSTVVFELGLIRPFLKWLWERRVIDGDRYLRLRDVPPPRGGNTWRPRPYSRKEIGQLFADLEAQYPLVSAESLRRWRAGQAAWRRVMRHAKRLQLEAILALALYGGMRRDEIFRVELDDMDWQNEYVVVRGKRDANSNEQKVRIVPINKPMREALRAWLEFREELDPPHDRPWLSLHAQHRLKPLRLRQYTMLMTTLGRGWEFHRLRHTFATEQLNAGVEIDRLQEIMGHADISMTRRYAQLTTAAILKSAARAEATFLRALDRERLTANEKETRV